MVDYKDLIVKELTQVKRLGMVRLLEWMTGTSDFFEAPASRNLHLSIPGGLAQHSWNVFSVLRGLVESFKLTNQINEDSVRIVGLLHDLCKTGFYEIDETDATPPQMDALRKNLKGESRGILYSSAPADKITKAWASDIIDWSKNGCNGPMPQKKIAYKHNDKLPFGHGEKSVFLIVRWMNLSDEEALSIRWHMGAWTPGAIDKENKTFNAARDLSPLVSLAQVADALSANIMELTFQREER